MTSNYLPERGIVVHTCGCTSEAYFLSGGQRQALALPVDMDAVVERVVKGLHEGDKPAAKDSRAIIQETYGQLRQAVKEGYGNLSFQVQFGGVNFEMAKQLQTNVAVFSALKKHDMVRELVKALRNDDGSLKSFGEYRKVAMPMVGKYREDFLHREYDAGVRGCRMATVWQDIQKTRRLYPNIKYIRSRSANKRDDHLALVGTILPIDHPFWGIHFPPNGWGCKCGAQPTDEVPTEVPATLDNIPDEFKMNVGKDGQVFNVKEHPYAQLPKKEYEQAAKEAWGALCSYERDSILSRAKESGLFDKKIRVPGVAGAVELNATSYKKNLQFNSYFFEKLSLLENIEEVLEDSTVLMTENKKPKQDVEQFIVLEYKTIEGKRINLHVMETKERKNKKKQFILYYVHIQK